MRSPSDLGSMYLLLTFVLWVFFSDLGFVYLLLTWILCVPLLTKVLCIFFWLGSYAFLCWPGFYVSSSDLDPMRSSYGQGSMYILLTLILCVPLLTRVLCIFFWLWSYTLLFWTGFYISSSDFYLLWLFLLTWVLCVPPLTLVLWIFFWRWSYALIFWPGICVSSSDVDPMRSSFDLGSMHLLLTLF